MNTSFKFTKNEIELLIEGLEERRDIYKTCLEDEAYSMEDIINGFRQNLVNRLPWERVVNRCKILGENDEGIKLMLDKALGMNTIIARLEKRLEKLKNVKK